METPGHPPGHGQRQQRQTMMASRAPGQDATRRLLHLWGPLPQSCKLSLGVRRHGTAPGWERHHAHSRPLPNGQVTTHTERGSHWDSPRPTHPCGSPAPRVTRRAAVTCHHWCCSSSRVVNTRCHRHCESVICFSCLRIFYPVLFVSSGLHSVNGDDSVCFPLIQQTSGRLNLFRRQ